MSNDNPSPRNSGGTFTQSLWKEIEGIFGRILAHPFIEGLTEATLPRDAFQFYVVQDSHYLREFARALSVAAAKSPEDEWIIMFNEHAAEALRVERVLHESFFKDFKLSEEAVRSAPMAPTNVAYTSYLLSVAYSRPFCELVAALLPCYWIYWEVGKALAEKGSPEPLYQRWIDTYAAEEFAEVVRQVIGLTDKLEPTLTDADRVAMAAHFVTTSRYEWMFWEMGWQKEEWPV